MMEALGISLELIDQCKNYALPSSKIRRHYMLRKYADDLGGGGEPNCTGSIKL